MKKALAVALMGALFAGFAMAQPYFIELDLDAVTGNGPDLGAAETSDYVDISCWVMGAGAANLISANYTLCNADGFLEFQGYAGATGWNHTAPQAAGPGCYLVQATDFALVGLPAPFLHGVATFHVAGNHAFADVYPDPDPGSGGWSDLNFAVGSFEPGVGCGIQIGGSATEQSNWGAVKELFR